MSRYELSPAADADLLALFRYGIQTYGPERAAQYHDELLQVIQIIADFPELAHERKTIRPPVRIHHHARHYIIYRIVKGHVRVVRILRDEVVWARHLGRKR